MQFNLNSDVSFILEQLNKNGSGFLVGGAVRDMIIGRNPGDYDFATDIEYKRSGSPFWNTYDKAKWKNLRNCQI